MARLSTGRKKIEMKKITKESNLLVTFSKRRAGLFKKASELCMLCGVEMALAVFSPGNKKVYSFGNPNVKHVMDKFSSDEPTTDSGVLQSEDLHAAEHSMLLTQVHDELEAQMTHGEWLADLRKQSQTLSWLEAPTEDLELEKLKTLSSGLAMLKTSVTEELNHQVAMMEQVQKLASSSAEFQGVEATDGSGAPLPVVMTPQGYVSV